MPFWQSKKGMKLINMKKITIYKVILAILIIIAVVIVALIVDKNIKSQKIEAQAQQVLQRISNSVENIKDNENNVEEATVAVQEINEQLEGYNKDT